MPDYKEMYLIMVRAAEQAQKHPHRGPAKVRGDVPGRPGRRGLTHDTRTFLDFPTAFSLFFRLFLLYSRKRRRFA